MNVTIYIPDRLKTEYAQVVKHCRYNDTSLSSIVCDLIQVIYKDEIKKD